MSSTLWKETVVQRVSLGSKYKNFRILSEMFDLLNLDLILLLKYQRQYQSIRLTSKTAIH